MFSRSANSRRAHSLPASSSTYSLQVSISCCANTMSSAWEGLDCSGCGLSAPAVELTLTEIKWSMALAAPERTGVSYALWSGHQPLCDSPVPPTTACDGPEQVFSTRCGPATWRSVCLEAVAQRLSRRSDAGRQGARPERADDGPVRLAVQISASGGPLGVRRQARHRQGCERRSQGFGTPSTRATRHRTASRLQRPFGATWP
jgi:hypothetical protein